MIKYCCQHESELIFKPLSTMENAGAYKNTICIEEYFITRKEKYKYQLEQFQLWQF